MCETDNISFKTRNLGDTFEAHLDPNDKITKKWHKEPPQRYTGEIVNGNIHRHGFYFIENGDKLFYDGLFYANKLEGYAQIFYNDGRNFQGLFKNNIRFGPGVLTYPNGEQDVGLWNGQYLTRMSGLNERNLVPRLASTPKGQMKLLKYRYLVPVSPKHDDVAYAVLENLGANEKVLQQSDKLYNMEVKNKRSIFFNRNVFNRQYRINQDCYIDTAFDGESDDNEPDDGQNQDEDSTDINAERIKQISKELEKIEDRLRSVKKKKLVVEKRVEYCKACCINNREGDRSTPPGGLTAVSENVETTGKVKSIDALTSRSFAVSHTSSTTVARLASGYPGTVPVTKSSFTFSHLPSVTQTPTAWENPDAAFEIYATAPVKQRSHETRQEVSTTDDDAAAEPAWELEGKYPVIPLTSIITRYSALAQTNAQAASPLSTISEEKITAKSPDTETVSVSRDASVDDYNLSEMEYARDELQEESESKVDDHIQDYLQDCICDEVIHPTDLYEMEKELDAIARDETFYESISINLKMKLEMHLQKCRDNTKAKTKKMLVKELLAWNNEENCMCILRHSFLHRRSEYMVNFKVPDVVAGNRTRFGSPGPHEKNCTKFLAACSTGDDKSIFTHVNRDYVDVNVCDGKGNSGVMFAAVNRQIETLRILTNLGAKLDQENDEGLLPLSVCFLQFLAEKHNVDDWEKAFLPDTEPLSEQTEAVKWYQNMSLLSVLAKGEKSKDSVKNKTRKNSIGVSKPKERRPYIFDLGFVVPTMEEIMNMDDDRFTFKKTKSVSMAQRHTTLDAIRTLLECGANPNAGDAPLPPLILSVFTGDPNLVECVLTAKADVNVTVAEDMTPLHIVASLKCSQANVEICNLLLGFDADPRLKISTDHWPEQKAAILGKDVDADGVKDEGKNALHILCARRDLALDQCSYFQQMAMVLTDSNIDANEKYLGHTPLSLAVLVGNEALVETLIKLRLIDPHQPLDYGLGNVLTIYILKRYRDLLPPNAKEMLKFLVDLRVNPLRQVSDCENCIAFIEREHEIVEGKKTKKNKSTEAVKTTSKKANKEVKHQQEELMDYIKELCRNIIMQSIQLQAVENLYNLVEEHLTEHECVTILAEFLTPFVIISNLQHLFSYGKIKGERYDKNRCLQIIHIVDAHHEEMAKRTSKKKEKKSGSLDQKKVTISTGDYGHILDMTNFSRIQKAKAAFRLLPPGLDNPAKYKVCFHCLKKTNKTLLVCPRCQLIYFCSDSCNKANIKLKTPHPCNINFYSSELMDLKSNYAPERQDFAELYERIRESCSKRRISKLEEQNDLMKKQFAKEIKTDVYGTMMLRRKRLKKIVRTPTMTTLVGSVSDIPRLNMAELETTDYSNVNNMPSNYSVSNRGYSLSHKQVEASKQLVKHTVSEEKYRCMVSKKHESSLMEVAAAKNKKETGQRICRKIICECVSEDCIVKEKRESNYKCFRVNNEKKIEDKSHMHLDTSADAGGTVKKLREIPNRYQQFIELLTTYFPDIDFSTLFLPYACFSEGQLYYKFLDKDVYTRTYSMM